MPRLTVDLHRLVAVRHVVGHGLFVVEAVAKLIEERDPQVGAEPHGTCRRGEFTEHQPEQRGLARAVWADDADPIAPHHGRGKIVNDRPRAAQKRHSFERRHEGPAAIGLLDLELHAADRIPPLAALPAQRLQGPHAALVPRAAGLDARANPDFFLRELLVEEGILFFFRGEGLLLPHEKRVVVARPVEDPAPVDLENPVGHVPEKRAVVGDEHERSPPAAEKRFEPLHRLDVEVVRGLVEQEEVGLPDDRPREQHAALHSRRERLEGSGSVECHPPEHLLDGLLALPGRLGVRPGRQAGGDDIVHGAGEVLGHVLLQERDRRPRRIDHRAAVGLDRACEQSQ